MNKALNFNLNIIQFEGTNWYFHWTIVNSHITGHLVSKMLKYLVLPSNLKFKILIELVLLLNFKLFLKTL